MIELCCKYLSVWCIDCDFYHATYEFRVKLFSKLSECKGAPCSKQGRYLKFKVTETGLAPTTNSFVNKYSTI